MLTSDYSFWHFHLRDASLHLLNFEGSLWELSPDKDSYLKRTVTATTQMNMGQFKVLLGAALEYATKAVCLSHQIDILKTPKASKSANGPFFMVQAGASSNPWLAGVFASYGVKTANDINTQDFSYCLNQLKKHFFNDPNALAAINDTDVWREFHRNTDAHISLKITTIENYEQIRPSFNHLISLVKF